MAEFYSIINASYQAKEARSKSTLQHYMLLISLLSVVLALLFAYLYKQLRKLSRTKEELSQANLRLTQLNDELNDKNAQLSDSNDLKEQYIARFFDLCSLYIDKMDSYRKTLNRLAQNRQFDELFKRLKSTSMMENELDELYKMDAMNVDSDIRVMETMLRRDTATVEKDFGLGTAPAAPASPKVQDVDLGGVAAQRQED